MVSRVPGPSTAVTSSQECTMPIVPRVLRLQPSVPEGVEGG